MIRTFATAICVALTLTAAGQKQRKQTVVLNDGSRISGTIVTDSSDYLEIKVVVPQILKIRKAQVSSMEPVTYPVIVNQKIRRLLYSFIGQHIDRRKRTWQYNQLQFSPFQRLSV